MSFLKDPQRRPFFISIAAILLVFVVVFPWVKSVQKRQLRDADRLAAMRTLEAAIEQYAGRSVILPNTDASKNGFVCVTDIASGLSVLVEQKLLTILPELPRGECVQYRSDGKDYKLKIKLETTNLNTQDQGSAPDSAEWFEISTVTVRGW